MRHGAMAAAFVVAMATGAAVHCVVQQPTVVFIDEVLYADVARSIAYEGVWVKHCPLSDQQLPSLYSLVISPAFAYGRGSGMRNIHRYILWINLGLAAFTAWLGFAFLRGYGAGCAWCGAVVALIWPSCAVYRHTVMSENVFLPALLAAVACVHDVLRARSTAWRSILVGALFGVMYGIRPISAVAAICAALVIMWRPTGWRGLITCMASAIIVGALVMLPDVLWGTGTMYIYAGREHEWLGSLAAIVRHEGWLRLCAERMLYHIVYYAAAALVLPVVAGWAMYVFMPRAWRAVWLCMHGCCVVLGIGSAIHTFSEVPEKIDFIGRYMDPFITLIVLLSIPAVVRMRSGRLFVPAVLCMTLWCMLAWLPIRCEWWMQTLPITYLRCLHFIHPRLPLCAWFVGLCVTVASIACLRRAIGVSVCLALSVVLAINYLNAYEYQRYGRMMEALGTRAQRVLAADADITADEIALRIKSEGDDTRALAALVRMMLYYNQLGNDDARQ